MRAQDSGTLAPLSTSHVNRASFIVQAHRPPSTCRIPLVYLPYTFDEPTGLVLATAIIAYPQIRRANKAPDHKVR
jgi:hypothetical protein